MAFRFLTRRLPLLALFGIGYLLAQRKGTEFPTGDRSGSKPEKRGPQAKRGSGEDGSVRAAGSAEMKNPPPEWDKVDEANDESFPASDPAAKY